MVVVYHEADKMALPHILQEGILWGDEGAFSREPATRKANDFLDECRPKTLRSIHLSRRGCIYAYLTMADRLMDISTGAFCEVDKWRVSQERVKLALNVDPATAYVSDLDAYDELKVALRLGKNLAVCRALAGRYWQRIFPMKAIMENYRLQAHGLVCTAANSGELPPLLKRVEVMLVASVPPECIKRV